MMFSGGAPTQESVLTALQGWKPASSLPLLGVNTHLNRGGAGGGPTPNATNISLLQTTSSAITRIDMVNWDQIEQSLGVYTWTVPDAMIALLRSAGIKFNIPLGYSNPLYGSPGYNSGLTTQAQITAYCNYCVAAANRYNGPDVQFEVRNEVNISFGWAPSPNSSFYTNMMKQAAAAIKAAQPTAVVLTSGISNEGAYPSWGNFVQGMAAAGNLANADGVAFHPYGQGDLVGQPPESSLFHIIDYLNATGRQKPLYLNEWGYPYSWSSNSTGRQAILVARMLLTAIIAGPKTFIAYDLIDDGTDYTNDENTYGLYDASYAIKPAGTAWLAIMGALAGCTSYGFGFDPVQKLCVLTVMRSAGQSVIAWTYDTGTKTVLKIVNAFTSYTLKNLAGSAQSISVSNGVASFSVTEAGGPVILTAAY